MSENKAKGSIAKRRYGSTGIDVTMLGFGGMRFENPKDLEASAETVFHAYRRGVTYFDTAPGYCDDTSEEIIGLAVKEMKKDGGEFFLSTKSMKSDGVELRRELEQSLKRLNVEAIDFYNCWYILTLEAWEERKKGGAVDEIIKAKEEGLIRHPVFSTHLPGGDIRRVIEEGYFEGVTLGYSAVNFPYREEGIASAKENNLGVVVMNPLGGGTIVNNPESFSFIKRYGDQPIVDAALHFLWDHDEITVALVGCRNKHDVDAAADAAEAYVRSETTDIEAMKKRITTDFNQLCTSCKYCDVCPEDIPVWKFLETANHVVLNNDTDLSFHLKAHWGADPSDMERCIECGRCESACTQQLPIMDRFKLLQTALEQEAAAK